MNYRHLRHVSQSMGYRRCYWLVSSVAIASFLRLLNIIFIVVNFVFVRTGVLVVLVEDRKLDVALWLDEAGARRTDGVHMEGGLNFEAHDVNGGVERKTGFQ